MNFKSYHFGIETALQSLGWYRRHPLNRTILELKQATTKAAT